MCLAVPAEVLEVDPLRFQAKVDYLGSQITVGTRLLERVEPGQFVLVHVGDAIAIVDRAQAADGIALWEEWLRQS